MLRKCLNLVFGGNNKSVANKVHHYDLHAYQDGEKLPLMSGASVISSLGLESKINDIKLRSRAMNEHFNEAYYLPILRLAEAAQLAPASEAYHHYELGGFIVHTLDVVEIALGERKNYMLPEGGTVEQQTTDEPKWTYAIFVCALLHDVGKLVTQHSLRLVGGGSYTPYSRYKDFVNPDNPNERSPYRYDVVFNKDRKYETHQYMGTAFLAEFFGHKELTWLAQDNLVFDSVVEYLSDHASELSAVKRIVQKADMKSTGDYIRQSTQSPFLGSVASKQEQIWRQVRNILQDEIASGRHNKNGAMLQIDGNYLYINIEILRVTYASVNNIVVPADGTKEKDIFASRVLEDFSNTGQFVSFYNEKKNDYGIITSVKYFEPFKPEGYLWRGQVVVKKSSVLGLDNKHQTITESSKGTRYIYPFDSPELMEEYGYWRKELFADDNNFVQEQKLSISGLQYYLENYGISKFVKRDAKEEVKKEKVSGQKEFEALLLTEGADAEKSNNDIVAEAKTEEAVTENEGKDHTENSGVKETEETGADLKGDNADAESTKKDVGAESTKDDIAAPESVDGGKLPFSVTKGGKKAFNYNRGKQSNADSPATKSKRNDPNIKIVKGSALEKEADKEVSSIASENIPSKESSAQNAKPEIEAKPKKTKLSLVDMGMMMIEDSQKDNDDADDENDNADAGDTKDIAAVITEDIAPRGQEKDVAQQPEENDVEAVSNNDDVVTAKKEDIAADTLPKKDDDIDMAIYAKAAKPKRKRKAVKKNNPQNNPVNKDAELSNHAGDNQRKDSKKEVVKREPVEKIEKKNPQARSVARKNQTKEVAPSSSDKGNILSYFKSESTKTKNTSSYADKVNSKGILSTGIFSSDIEPVIEKSANDKIKKEVLVNDSSESVRDSFKRDFASLDVSMEVEKEEMKRRLKVIFDDKIQQELDAVVEQLFVNDRYTYNDLSASLKTRNIEIMNVYPYKKAESDRSKGIKDVNDYGDEITKVYAWDVIPLPELAGNATSEDYGECFLQWLALTIFSRKYEVNRTKSPIHKIQGKYLSLTTPILFLEFLADYGLYDTPETMSQRDRHDYNKNISKQVRLSLNKIKDSKGDDLVKSKLVSNSNKHQRKQQIFGILNSNNDMLFHAVLIDIEVFINCINDLGINDFLNGSFGNIVEELESNTSLFIGSGINQD